MFWPVGEFFSQSERIIKPLAAVTSGSGAADGNFFKTVFQPHALIRACLNLNVWNLPADRSGTNNSIVAAARSTQPVLGRLPASFGSPGRLIRLAPDDRLEWVGREWSDPAGQIYAIQWASKQRSTALSEVGRVSK